MCFNRLRIALGFALLLTINSVSGQGGFPTPVRGRPIATPPPRVFQTVPMAPMRKPPELIRRIEPVKINQRLLEQATPDNVRIHVSLSQQRAYLLIGEQVVVDSPISSGKRGHESPHGSFSVREKDPSHYSSIYGDFVDGSGRVVRAGVSAKIDSAPSGTHFVGAPMRWFMRLTDEGVGMHVGILPGYPASHGCIRMPSDGAKLFYDHVKVGTPVTVGAADVASN